MSVLLIRSNNHAAVPESEYARMQTLIADCVASEMTHQDHNVHLGDKEQFYGYMEEFLNRALRRKIVCAQNKEWKCMGIHLDVAGLFAEDPQIETVEITPHLKSRIVLYFPL